MDCQAAQEVERHRQEARGTLTSQEQPKAIGSFAKIPQYFERRIRCNRLSQ
jgi:hypothetical protein